MNISEYNRTQTENDRRICERLMSLINTYLPEAESKIWHRHPVWFLDGNPTVGYSKLKDCIRLMFWSGMGFEELELKPGTGKFKDASMQYTRVDQISEEDLKRWLEKSRTIQWDYKNIVKKKGRLDRL
ncbi:DUF1801 domain-containing protein [Ekhidna sp.]|uniref:DUF1801 domain-containing protein n=1 Tax=Ekhidna sp. TaxID=2608089 RepID=UPI003B5946DF